ncbi:hypothetical protein QFC21_003601 [Naganishia friedmannii]|uniref:Uncharacterized protein n=1 Tax=Naganishia friedmannii TaxID=89922 RepID=A0ACC2VN23_9TREE|nr:hypothetical protein QFC21_003601 [Naganishia friedmannii]
MSIVINAGSPEAKQLQDDIQHELVARGKTDEGDETMAEYVTVMLINQKTADQINEELSDLQGIDFDPTFTTWIFQRAARIALGPASTVPEIKTEILADMMAEAQPEGRSAFKAESEDGGMDVMDTSTSGLSRPNRAVGNAGPRLLSHALAPLGNQPIRTYMTQGVKRGFSPDASGSEESKRRSLGNSRHAPSGPRAMRDEHGSDDTEDRDSRMNTANGAGRSLLDRLGGPPLNHHAPEFHVGAGGARGRGGFARGRGGHLPNGNQRPFVQRGPPNGGPGFFPPPFPGGPEAFAMQSIMVQQQEQMMQMQMMMQQMAQAMQTGATSTQPQQIPRRHITAQPKQQIGGHTISARPAGTVTGNRSLVNESAFPDKPTSLEICKFGVGCTNKRCPYSHPSPVATEASGMVLRSEACPNGKGCKDPDCPYSHVSPAQVEDVPTGPSKILCKYPDCTNPSCQFRHEDANGNPIPPPALTRQLAAAAAAPDATSAMETDQPSQDNIHVKVDQSSSSAGLAAGKPLESTSTAVSAKPLPGKPLNATIPVPCRFGAGCTNVKCKFIHENKKPCNFGVKCFKADCPYSHPPGRKIPSTTSGEGIVHGGFSTYKPKQSSLADRTFGGESEPAEKVLPGSGLPGNAVRLEPGNGVKVEQEDDITVTMG